MLATNPNLEVACRIAPKLGRHLDQLTDAALIERSKWVMEQSCDHVFAQEAPRVISRYAHGGLGKVVGSEAEELCVFRDFVGQRHARGSSIMVPTV